MGSGDFDGHVNRNLIIDFFRLLFLLQCVVYYLYVILAK